MNLVIGASGQLGRRIVRQLLQRGEPVRAVSRNPSRIADLAKEGAEVIRGDLLDVGWMDEALQGVRQVVLAAQGFFPPSRSNNPEQVDEAGARRLIDAARRGDVEHVVFVSISMAGPDSPVLFGRLKYRVEEYLKASGLEYTIVRPTTFIETHALLLIGESLRAKGKVSFMGNADTPANWISAEDLATLIVDVLCDPERRATTVTAGGPDVLSRAQVLSLFERAMDHKARRTDVPVAALRAMRYVVGPFHPGMRYLLDFGLADARLHDDRNWTSPALDWTGDTSVQDAIDRWMAPG